MFIVDDIVDYWIEEVKQEFCRATEKFDKFNSKHEGWAVIKEELDELWDEIKGKQRPERITEEAVQVAAMALRFLYDMVVMEDR